VRPVRANVHNCAAEPRARPLAARRPEPNRPKAVARILHWSCGRRTGGFKRSQDKAKAQGSTRCDMYVMKIITAIVRPFKLDEMRHAIAQLGVQGVTVTEVYEAEHGPRAKVEIAVDDSIVEPVLEAIANISRTGRNGDGTILVG